MTDNIEPDENIELPTEPTTEQILSGGDPEMEERFKNAGRGKYEHTLIEIWEDTLRRELEGYSDQASLDTYEQFLRNWPWLKYSDVEPARRLMITLTQEGLDALDAGVKYILEDDPRTLEEVMASHETDWVDNSKYYLEIVARWSALMIAWGERWAYTSMTLRPTLHVAIGIACARLVGQHGLVEQMKHIANFQSTDEDQTALGLRIQELNEEAGRA